MNLWKYQEEAREFALYPSKAAVTYTALGLASEAGEVAGKVKKVIRDRGGFFWDTDTLNAISSEIGDVLWYLAALSSDLGLSLDDIAIENIKKLKDRQSRGVIQGSGDNR